MNPDIRPNSGPRRLATPGQLGRGAAVVLTLCLAGCAQPTATDHTLEGNRAPMSAFQPPARRSTPGPVRTDLAPLTKRFPALGTPVDAHWQAGTLGSAEGIGPTSYWLDAVVRLTHEAATELRLGQQLAAGPLPAISDGVRAALPDETWLTGPTLDRAFSTGGFSTHALIATHADVVVLSAAGAGT